MSRRQCAALLIVGKEVGSAVFLALCVNCIELLGNEDQSYHLDLCVILVIQNAPTHCHPHVLEELRQKVAQSLLLPRYRVDASVFTHLALAAVGRDFIITRANLILILN